jgi:tetratricopeptide (TPR) repeat protein
VADAVQHRWWQVIDGEALSTQQLAQLAKTVAALPNDKNLLLLAQALINANQPRDALDVLRRSLTRSRDICLAQARALVLLEHWSEAKKLLLLAQQQVPTDPEVLKALAVVALREGQWAQVRRWLSLAREADPLDEDTQLLQQEADTLVAVEATKAVKWQMLRAKVGAGLSRRHAAFCFDTDAVWVRTKMGALVRIDAPFISLHQSVDSALDEAVALDASTLASGEQLMAAVWPALRPKNWPGFRAGAVKDSGPADLFLVYAVKLGSLVQCVTETQAEKLRLRHALRSAAMANLQQQVSLAGSPHSLLMVLAEAPRARVLVFQDGFDGARLLTPALRQALEHCWPGQALQVRFLTPHRVAVWPFGDAETETMVHLGTKPSEGYVTEYRWMNDTLTKQ